MKRRLAFMGTPDFAAVALEAIIAAGHDVVCVYSQPPRPAKRGQTLQKSPVHLLAEAHGIEVRTPLNFKAEEDRAAFASLDLDVAVVAAYGLILPQALLDAPKFGCLNIHASLLPRWRGAAPIHRAIEAGDAETGICIMQMEAGLDTGPVLLREVTPILESDTTAILHDRLAAMGGDLIVSVLNQLESLKPEVQAEAGVTYAKKIDKAEARIDWTRPASEIARKVRALNPFPGAVTEIGKDRVKLLETRVESSDGQPGTVLDDRLLVACGEGALRILTLQKAGKSAMDADAFLRGTRLPKGTVLP